MRRIAARRGWDVDVHPLPALLHNRPERIAGEVAAELARLSDRYERVVVAYADCGTRGRSTRVVEELGVSRLAGAHCYDVFASAEVRAAMAEAPGTYFLTDFLARSFEHTVWRELGLDRHPELRDAYFGNYTRVLWLAQRPTAGTRARRPSAPRRRLGLPLEEREVGDIGLEREPGSPLACTGVRDCAHGRQLRLHHRRRRLRRLRARQPALAGSFQPGARSRGGSPGLAWDVFIHMPAALAFPIGSRFYDWKYESEPEPHMGGRRVYHARGKVLGGSSSVNGMIFQRGNPMDYERWASGSGMGTWDHAHCLPYFKRMENCLAARADDPFRGHGGPLVLERGPARGPLFDAFFAAVQEAGYPLTEDVNGYRQEGFAAFDRNVHDGRRLSAARAYLHPVKDRSNLDVKTFALTTKILFDGTRATGVEYSLPDRRTRQAQGGEVILCGGAINSPQLLQLSGVGAASELRGFGIPVVSDVPGVGENLQDHLEVYVQHSSRQPISMAPYFAMKNRPKVGAEWLLRKSGPGATNHFEAGGFIRGNEEVEYPNLMYHFLPIAVRYDGTLPPGGGGHGYQVHVGPMYSDVRGTLQDHVDRPAQAPGAALQLPLDRERPQGVDRGDPRDAQDPRRSRPGRTSTAASCHRAPRWRATSRSSTGWPRTPRPRCIPPAPAGWASTTWR